MIVKQFGLLRWDRITGILSEDFATKFDTILGKVTQGYSSRLIHSNTITD